MILVTDGRIPRDGRVLGLQHLAAVGFDQQQCFGAGRARRKQHRGCEGRSEQVEQGLAKQRAKGVHYPIPVLGDPPVPVGSRDLMFGSEIRRRRLRRRKPIPARASRIGVSAGYSVMK
ncbi:hypothetical protein ACVWZ3_007888 [Bradyrhizobium sp. i1.3.6]